MAKGKFKIISSSLCENERMCKENKKNNPIYMDINRVDGWFQSFSCHAKGMVYLKKQTNILLERNLEFYFLLVPFCLLLPRLLDDDILLDLLLFECCICGVIS